MDDLTALRNAIGPSAVLLTRVRNGPLGQDINMTYVDGLNAAAEFVAEQMFSESPQYEERIAEHAAEELLSPFAVPPSERADHNDAVWKIPNQWGGTIWTAQINPP
ncbi:hypothetical protein [Candidatus Poriferisodalis sp.]|uniref:hypothetical protein n=1 Tax=Candidatus Poriferisodalis sp. TaxID=3101277 RepID=UPI003B02C505